MQELKNELAKGILRKCYYFYGVERYLLDMYTEKLKRAVLTEEEEMMNLSVMEGNVDPDSVLAVLDTLPFLAEHRLLILKNTPFFVTKKEVQEGEPEYDKYQEKLLQAIENTESTIVLFIENEGKTSQGFGKKLAQVAKTVDFKTQSEDVLIKWLGVEAKKQGFTLDSMAAAFMVSYLGNDMTFLSQELEKLYSLKADNQVITKDDITRICTRNVDEPIFAITNGISNRKAAVALEAYARLLEDGASPNMVLSYLIGEFRNIFRAKLLLKEGKSFDEIASALGAGRKTYPYVNQSKCFSEECLRDMLSEMLELDTAIKNSDLSATDACILVITKYAAK